MYGVFCKIALFVMVEAGDFRAAAGRLEQASWHVLLVVFILVHVVNLFDDLHVHCVQSIFIV